MCIRWATSRRATRETVAALDAAMDRMKTRSKVGVVRVWFRSQRRSNRIDLRLSLCPQCGVECVDDVSWSLAATQISHSLLDYIVRLLPADTMSNLRSSDARALLWRPLASGVCGDAPRDFLG